jgi:hypothetical protein
MAWQNLTEDLAEEFEQPSWQLMALALDRRNKKASARAREGYALDGPARREHLERVLAWQAANPEKQRKYQRDYQRRRRAQPGYVEPVYQRDPVKRAAWRLANQEHLRQCHRAWRLANQEHVRKYKRERARLKRAQARTK